MRPHTSTRADAKPKRYYALAYGRAMRQLRSRHPEEFDAILEEEKKLIRVELDVFGEVHTASSGGRKGGSPPRHVAGASGVCEECGEVSPCRVERRRMRDQRDRVRASDSQEE